MSETQFLERPTVNGLKSWNWADDRKASFRPGEWMNEPDKMQWKTKAGLDGLIVRNSNGCLCGYVGIGPQHPNYQKKYDDLHVSCHGGLTYGDMCQGAICHVPEPGEPEHLYWLGFDCAHSGDDSPSHAHYREWHATYRDIDYVRDEVESLAEQLAALSN